MVGWAYRVTAVLRQIEPGSGGLALQRQRGANEHQPARLPVVPERLRVHGQLLHGNRKVLIQLSLLILAGYTVVR